MKEKYQKMMNALSLPQAFAQDIEERLNAKTKRSQPLIRTIAIAACVSLLVAGTVLAASQNAPNTVSVIDQDSKTAQASYSVQAELQQKAVSSLSADLQADLTNWSVDKAFRTKSELEAHLGFCLIRSSGLEASGIVEYLSQDFLYHSAYMDELALDTSARYILSQFDQQTLKVSAHRVVHNTEVYLAAYICIGEATGENLIKNITGETFTPVRMIDVEFQYDENGMFILGPDGAPLTTVTEYESAEHEFHYQEYTMPNGCVATIVTATAIERDGTRGFKEYMGYFIKDGILYTVKPYAVYDPNLSFPMNDYDCLTVLYEVLDLFE